MAKTLTSTLNASSTTNAKLKMRSIQADTSSFQAWENNEGTISPGLYQGWKTNYTHDAFVGVLHFGDLEDQSSSLRSIDWKTKKITSIAFNYTIASSSRNSKVFRFWQCNPPTGEITAKLGSSFLNGELGSISVNQGTGSYSLTMSSTANTSLFNNFVSYLKEGAENICLYWDSTSINSDTLFRLSKVEFVITYEDENEDKKCFAYKYIGGSWNNPYEIWVYHNNSWKRVTDCKQL